MRKIILGLFATLCMSAAAQAGTLTSFVEINSGFFDDATDGNRTFAYRIISDTDWTNSDLRINLTSGSMINHLEDPAFGDPFAVPQINIRTMPFPSFSDYCMNLLPKWYSYSVTSQTQSPFESIV